MMQVKIIAATTALTAMALLAGCSEAPTQAVQDAQAALAAVEQAGAAQYAPADLATANDAMARLEAEMAVQGEKWSMMRRYGRAGELAAEARAIAESALVVTNEARETARTNALARIEEAAAALEAVRPVLAAAPRGKGSDADLKVLEGDLTAVETALGEARATVEAGDFIAAEAKAAAALQSVNDVSTAIETARQLQAGAAGR